MRHLNGRCLPCFSWVVPALSAGLFLAPAEAGPGSVRRESVRSALIAGSNAGQSARAAARELSGSVRMGDMGWMAERMYPPLKHMLALQMEARRKKGQEAELSRRARGMGKAISPEESGRLERALEEHYRRMGEEMRKAGVVVESFSVGEPFSEYEVTPPGALICDGIQVDTAVEDVGTDSGERSRVVVLPTTLVVTSPDGRGGRMRTARKSYLYAVRDEASANRVRRKRLNQWFFIDASTDMKIMRTFFPDLPLSPAVPPVSVRTAPVQ